jgi:hypothetical protein
MTAEARETVMSRPILGRLGCAMLVVLGLAACQPRNDSPWSEGAAAARKATDTLVAMTKQAGRPPRQTDPAAAKLLDQIFTVAVFPPTPPAGSIEAIADWVDSAQQAQNLYLNTMNPSGFDNDVIAKAAAGRQNLITYSPEIGRSFDATLQLIGLQDDAMFQIARDHRGHMNKTEMRLADVTTKETVAILANVLSAIAIPDFSDAWRTARLEQLDAVGRGAARFVLSSDQKQAVVKATEAAENAATSQDVKGQLNAFSSWFR